VQELVVGEPLSGILPGRSGNALLDLQEFVAVADLVTAVRGEARWGDLKQKTLSDALRLRHTAEHVAIVEAIARRDEAAARAAMEAHLRSVKAMMFGP